MRWVGSGVVALMLLIAPECAVRPPVPPLGHVSERHAIRVRFHGEPHAIGFDFRNGMYRPSEVETAFAAVDEGIENLNRVLADTLRRAGYELTDDSRCDVHLVRKLYFETEARAARHGVIGRGEIVRAVFYVATRKERRSIASSSARWRRRSASRSRSSTPCSDRRS